MKTRIMYNLTDPKRRHVMQYALTIAVSVMVMLTSSVFAEDSGVAEAINSLMESFYGTIIKTAIVVVPVYLAIVALTMIFGGKNAVENARKGFLIAGGAILLVYGAPVIIATIIGILNKNKIGGTNSWSNLNPSYEYKG